MLETKDYATIKLRQFLPGKLGANTGEKDPVQNEIPGLHPLYKRDCIMRWT